MRDFMEALSKQHSINGRFDLLPLETIDEVVRRSRVPNSPGLYVIFDGLGCQTNVIYIGRAGTIRQDGTWLSQGLSARLCRKQSGKYRKHYFREVIEQRKVPGLSFAWFALQGDLGILPCLVEAQALQRYFEAHKCLPPLNKS